MPMPFSSSFPHFSILYLLKSECVRHMHVFWMVQTFTLCFHASNHSAMILFLRKPFDYLRAIWLVFALLSAVKFINFRDIQAHFKSKEWCIFIFDCLMVSCFHILNAFSRQFKSRCNRNDNFYVSCVLVCWLYTQEKLKMTEQHSK